MSEEEISTPGTGPSRVLCEVHRVSSDMVCKRYARTRMEAHIIGEVHDLDLNVWLCDEHLASFLAFIRARLGADNVQVQRAG